jgi:hypothetical protein
MNNLIESATKEEKEDTSGGGTGNPHGEGSPDAKKGSGGTGQAGGTGPTGKK